jgi:hypothetical protein
VTDLVKLARAPDLPPQRDRPPELDLTTAHASELQRVVEHHAQHAVDAKPRGPEAGVGAFPQSSRMKVTSIFDRYSVTLPFSTWAV